MASETRPGVSILILALIRFDVEKAYKIGLEIAKTNDATFQGIFVWSLTNPNRDTEYLSFVADADSINSIIEKVKSGLNLADNNILRMVTPTSRPKEKPPSTMTS